jgi:hypothetical protein
MALVRASVDRLAEKTHLYPSSLGAEAKIG